MATDHWIPQHREREDRQVRRRVERRDRPEPGRGAAQAPAALEPPERIAGERERLNRVHPEKMRDPQVSGHRRPVDERQTGPSVRRAHRVRPRADHRESLQIGEQEDREADADPPQDRRGNVRALAQNLQVLREHLKAGIRINSGYRTPEHNKKIGGARNSQHVFGTAADIVVAGHTPRQVKHAIETLIREGSMMQGGIGLYGSWVHYDIRGTPARWSK